MIKIKVGDIVICNADGGGTMGHKAGEWGKVYEIEDNLTARIQLAGYSRPKDSFFQASWEWLSALTIK